MAESLSKTMISYPKSSYLVKILVLLIIFCQHKMLAAFSSNKANRSTICSLLLNLAIKDKLSCQVISSDFFIHYHKHIEEALDILIADAVKRFTPPITEWMFAVPLLHFMMKNCLPFEQLQSMRWDYDDHTSRQVYY